MRHILFIWGVVLAAGVVWAAITYVLGISEVPAFLIGMVIGGIAAVAGTILADKYVAS